MSHEPEVAIVGAGPAGLDRRAEIAFGEFALQMQRYRIDRLDIAWRVERVSDVGDNDDDHHHGEHPEHDDEPTPLGAIDLVLRNDPAR